MEPEAHLLDCGDSDCDLLSLRCREAPSLSTGLIDKVEVKMSGRVSGECPECDTTSVSSASKTEAAHCAKGTIAR